MSSGAALKKELNAARRDWDAALLDTLVEIVIAAKSRDDIDDVLANFVGDDPAVLQVIDRYFASQPGAGSGLRLLTRGNDPLEAKYAAAAGRGQPPTPSKPAAKPSQGVPPPAPAAGGPAAGALRGVGAGSSSGSGEAGAAGLQAGVPAGPAAAERGGVAAAAGGAGAAAGGGVGQRVGVADNGKVLGLFKEGGKIRSKAGKGGKGGEGAGGIQLAQLERKVVNCLGCGKIFDCRQLSSEVTRFLESGGRCTFCGRQVRLTYRGGGEVEAEDDTRPLPDNVSSTSSAPGSSSTPGHTAAAAAGQAGGGGGAAEAAAEAAAVEFKNRLVGYDRESAKRTAVIDDQSDYFEVDTNAWLTDQERHELRQRRQVQILPRSSHHTSPYPACASSCASPLLAGALRWRRRQRDAREWPSHLTCWVAGCWSPTREPRARTVRPGPPSAPATMLWSLHSTPKKAGSQMWASADTSQPRRKGDAVPGSSNAHQATSAATVPGSVETSTAGPISVEEGVRKAAAGLKSLRVTPNPAVLNRAPVFVHAVSGAPANGPGGKPTGSGKAAASSKAGPPGTTLDCSLQQANGQGHKAGPSTSPANGGQAVPGKGERPGAGNTHRAAAQGPSRRTAPAPTGLYLPPKAMGLGNVSRLQDNCAEMFEEFGAEILYEDVEAALLAVEAARPFDLCPQEYKGLAPPPAPPQSPGRQAVPEADLRRLPPGLVLLKSWLSLERQADIITTCRALGLGSGGFYTPSYGPGQNMHLRMMSLGEYPALSWAGCAFADQGGGSSRPDPACLHTFHPPRPPTLGAGKHWEPRTHSYEPARASHDGATPPPLPASLTSLCQEALAAAQAIPVQGACLPPLAPDVCLVNFYEKTGRLGMHQDKDESSDSLRHGLPVVSFSLGDAADFLFGPTCEEVSGNQTSTAQRVRLESGDVLVFGGPSRMVFHARIGESRWRPPELCWWPEQGRLPAKGKEYPGLGYKRLQDKPPKTQPAATQLSRWACKSGTTLTSTSSRAERMWSAVLVALLTWASSFACLVTAQNASQSAGADMAGASVQLQQCLAEAATQLVDSIRASANFSSREASIRNATGELAYLGRACFKANLTTIRPIRILAPSIGSFPVWQRRAVEFEALTGIPVVLEPVSFFTNWTVLWLAGTVALYKGFADLGPLIRHVAEATLLYNDILPFYRLVSGVYNKKIIGLPMDGDNFLLYYRQAQRVAACSPAEAAASCVLACRLDLFQRYQLDLPQTWSDLLDMARLMNGTDTDGDGRPDLFGACLDMMPQCKISFHVAGMAASYIQNNGTQSGFWYDPDSDEALMRPLVGNNEAMRTVLQLLVDLQAFMPSEPSCSNANPAFLAGKCLMTIDWGGVFRATRTSNISLPGMLGIAPLPGSTQILDRTTLKLVNCTPALCPMAQPYRTARLAPNVTRTLPGAWVNSAPFLAFGGWTAGVAASSPSEVQLATLNFFAYLTSPNNSWADVLDVSGSVDPFRQQHLDPANIGRWTAAGYDQGTTLQYLSALRTALFSPNIALDARMAYVAKPENSYRNFLENGFWAAYNKNMASSLLAMEASFMQSSRDALQLLAKPDPLEMRQQYWYMLGRVSSVYSPRSPLLAPNNPVQRVDNNVAVILTACLIGGCMLLVGLGLLTWQRVVWMRRNHRSALGKLLPPGAGPDTTLVLTDVQDSTTLYECLPVEVMDACMRIAERIIRDLLAAHRGYESATEGDAFLCAFHSPLDAVLFCLKLQDALLHATWPQELLHCPGVPCCHPVTASPRPHFNKIVQRSVLRLDRGPLLFTPDDWLARSEQQSAEQINLSRPTYDAAYDIQLASQHGGASNPNNAIGVATVSHEGISSSAGDIAVSMKPPVQEAGAGQAEASHVTAYQGLDQTPPWSSRMSRRLLPCCCSESATEGDAFLCAFHSPLDAVLFCLKLQDALLHATWPQELLHCPGVPCCHPVTVSLSPQYNKIVQALNTSSLNCLPSSTAERQSLARCFPHALRRWSALRGVHADRAPPLSSALPASVLAQSQPLATRPTKDAQPEASGATGRLQQVILPRRQSVLKLQPGPTLFTPDDWLAWAEHYSVEQSEHSRTTHDTTYASPHSQLSMGSVFATLGAVWRMAIPAQAAQGLDSSAQLPQGSEPPSLEQQGGLRLGASFSSQQGEGGYQATLALAPPANYTATTTNMALTQALHIQEREHTQGDAATPSCLVFSGLRIRCGVHTGVASAQDVSYNTSSARMQYSGAPLALARAVCDAAQGAQILLSQACFAALPQQQLRDAVAQALPLPRQTRRMASAVASSGLANSDHGGRISQLKDSGPFGNTSHSVPHCKVEVAAVATPPSAPHGYEAKPPGASAPGKTDNEQRSPCSLMLWHVGEYVLKVGNAITTVTAGSLPNDAAALRLPSLDAVIVGMEGVHEQAQTSTSGGSASRSPRQALSRVAQQLARNAARRSSLALVAAEHCISPEAAEALHSKPGQQVHSLYSVLPAGLAPRLVLLGAPRAVRQTVPGALSAPYGSACVCFLYVVGLAELLAWDPQEAASALALFSALIKQQLMAWNGYLVEHVDGFVLAAFACPVSALRWACICQEHLKQLPWSDRLLAHPLAESLITAEMGSNGEARQTLVYRGLRIKVGADVGSVRSSLQPVTGVVAFRGRVMNRAARIASRAGSGQVLCSAAVWSHWSGSGAPASRSLSRRAVLGTTPELGSEGGQLLPRLSAVSQGLVPLKGVPEPVEVMQVSRRAEGSWGYCTPLPDP
ncbi:hypothetical protein QJQ45_017159 [Haematococcus lacustris]|nr:hypothetical protein QJQ45_017159 [Haematococcus lacustris]